MPVPLQRADTDHLTIPMPDDFYVHHALFCKRQLVEQNHFDFALPCGQYIIIFVIF